MQSVFDCILFFIYGSMSSFGVGFFESRSISDVRAFFTYGFILVKKGYTKETSVPVCCFVWNYLVQCRILVRNLSKFRIP